MIVHRVPTALLRGLTTGEVVTLVRAGGLEVGAHVELRDGGPGPDPIAAPYARWQTAPPLEGPWTAIIERIVDSADLDPSSFAARHLVDGHPDGPIAVVRVYRGPNPVLSDTAFAARVSSIDRALR